MYIWIPVCYYSATYNTNSIFFVYYIYSILENVPTLWLDLIFVSDSFSVRWIFNIKLNGQEFSILAAGADSTTDDFKQTHIVPDGIDLDQMSSSFSADGVLVVKAPKKK